MLDVLKNISIAYPISKVYLITEQSSLTALEADCLGLNPGSVTYQQAYLFVPQFLHLQNESNDSTYLLGLTMVTNELIHVKCSQLCRVQS